MRFVCNKRCKGKCKNHLDQNFTSLFCGEEAEDGERRRGEGGETAVGNERAGWEEREDGCGGGQGAAAGEGVVRKVGRKRDVS